MNRNKPRSLIIGLGLIAMGFAGLLLKLGGGFGNVISWLLIGVGALEAILMGHLPMYFAMLLFMPFSVMSYYLFIPVKKKMGKVVDESGSPVIAWYQLEDRMVLVREIDILKTIEGTSVFRDQGKLQKMGVFLKKNGVPEYTLDEKRVRRAAASWNKDEQLLQRTRKNESDDWKAYKSKSYSLIHLDKYNEGSVARIHNVIEALWKSKKYRERQLEDIIQLALWYSLAVDVCYGREDQSFWDRISV